MYQLKSGPADIKTSQNQQDAPPQFIQSKIDLMQHAYRTYLDIDIVSSQHEFTTTILGMKPSYLSSMKARSRKPSLQVFERLLKLARLFLISCNRYAHLHKPYTVKLNHAHQKISELVRKLEEELFVIWVNKIEV